MRAVGHHMQGASGLFDDSRSGCTEEDAGTAVGMRALYLPSYRVIACGETWLYVHARVQGMLTVKCTAACVQWKSVANKRGKRGKDCLSVCLRVLYV